MNDTRFWNTVERHEGRFIGTADVRAFRKAMKRLGFEPSVVRERVEAIKPELLDEYDAISKRYDR